MGKFYVRLGGAVGDVGELKYGFNAPDDAYDNIGDELGVVSLDTDGTGQDDMRGVAFGINYPKAPRVRINYTDRNLGGGDSNDVKRSVTRFCDPDKIGRVLGGSINDKKIKVRGTEYQINSVSMPG